MSVGILSLASTVYDTYRKAQKISRRACVSVWVFKYLSWKLSSVAQFIQFSRTLVPARPWLISHPGYQASVINIFNGLSNSYLHSSWWQNSASPVLDATRTQSCFHYFTCFNTQTKTDRTSQKNCMYAPELSEWAHSFRCSVVHNTYKEGLQKVIWGCVEHGYQHADDRQELGVLPGWL